VVYSRNVEGKPYTFGISGRLYKSNVLFYDHQSESLWSQLMERAISGRLAGKKLDKVSSNRVNWRTWRKRHPNTMVLSTETGYRRDYARDPYEGYYRVGTIWFPVGDVRKDLSPKERVLGIQMGDEARAYDLGNLSKRAGILKDKVGGSTVRIEVNKDGQVVNVMDQEGNPIPHIFSYWFAWQAFHPKTTVYGETR
jgi:hypothetical protein